MACRRLARCLERSTTGCQFWRRDPATFRGRTERLVASLDNHHRSTAIISGALKRAPTFPADGPVSFDWVSSPQALESLAEILGDLTEFALDSESNSGFAYEEKLCLLQINAADSLWLVDLRALPAGQQALDPLRAIMEDPKIRVYVHGGEFDVGCFKRDYDIGLRGVWDSQQAASYLGWEKTGYGAVVERVLGLKLPKEHAHYDWSRRPIEGDVLKYALNDVRFLPRVCHSLRQEILEADLEEETDIAFRAVEEATWNGGYQPAGFWSLKGTGNIPSDSKPLLFDLYRWRDDIGRRLNLPPGRALHTELILALTRNPPSNASELKRLGLPRRITSKWSSELLDRIAKARREPPDLPARPPRLVLGRSQQKRGDRLKLWRRQEAKHRTVPLQVVLPLVALKYLQREGADDLEAVPQLGDKRIELYGDQIRQLCRT
jgi:ribonuclease D